MQQLDGKWSEWWRQSTDMCDSLQQQMGVVCSHQEATSQRLHHLEAQVPPPLMLPLTLPSDVASHVVL